MKKTGLFLAALGLILFLFVPLSRAREGFLLDFGVLEPVESVNVQRALVLSLDVDVETLVLVQGMIMTPFSLDRVQVSYGGATYSFANGELRVPLKNRQDTLVILEFHLTMTPSDVPGGYQSNLVLLEERKTGTTSSLLLLRALVLPWWVLVLDSEAIMDFQEDYTLVTRVPTVLRVASNANWEVYARSHEVVPRGQFFLRVLTKGITLPIGYDPVRVARGSRTTAGKGYWQEIPLQIGIWDFSRILAGRLSVSLEFQLAPTR